MRDHRPSRQRDDLVELKHRPSVKCGYVRYTRRLTGRVGRYGKVFWTECLGVSGKREKERIPPRHIAAVRLTRLPGVDRTVGRLARDDQEGLALVGNPILICVLAGSVRDRLSVGDPVVVTVQYPRGEVAERREHVLAHRDDFVRRHVEVVADLEPVCPQAELTITVIDRPTAYRVDRRANGTAKRVVRAVHRQNLFGHRVADEIERAIVDRKHACVTPWPKDHVSIGMEVDMRLYVRVCLQEVSHGDGFRLGECILPAARSSPVPVEIHPVRIVSTPSFISVRVHKRQEEPLDTIDQRGNLGVTLIVVQQVVGDVCDCRCAHDLVPVLSPVIEHAGLVVARTGDPDRPQDAPLHRCAEIDPLRQVGKTRGQVFHERNVFVVCAIVVEKVHTGGAASVRSGEELLILCAQIGDLHVDGAAERRDRGHRILARPNVQYPKRKVVRPDFDVPAVMVQSNKRVELVKARNRHPQQLLIGLDRRFGVYNCQPADRVPDDS